MTEDFFLKRMEELAKMSWHRDMVTFSDFLNLNEQNMLHSRCFRFPGVKLEAGGGYENAERQMIAFHPDALVFEGDYPIDCLRIRPAAAKYAEKLTHRDYLGALLNLGVDRGVIGDILVKENDAWFFVHRRMSEFFLDNLTRVRHTQVRISRVEHPEELPGPSFEEVSGTCASPRLDALIALAFRESRSSMVSFIEGGQVFVNGKLVTSNGYEPQEGDIISVRGRGRFLFDGVSRQTKKGRLGVRLRKYV